MPATHQSHLQGGVQTGTRPPGHLENGDIVKSIQSEWTGTVREVLVVPGESISQGAELLVVESMKMEIPVEAPMACTVLSVEVAVGETVRPGTVLATLAPADET